MQHFVQIGEAQPKNQVIGRYVVDWNRQRSWLAGRVSMLGKQQLCLLLDLVFRQISDFNCQLSFILIHICIVDMVAAKQSLVLRLLRLAGQPGDVVGAQAVCSTQ